MCGILLIVKKNEKILDKQKIDNSFKTLSVRGSEFQKLIFFDKYFNESSYSKDFKVALGHSRFVTYDFNANANMPFTDEKLGKYIIFNGDIYNHEILKKELLDKYTFKTKSDTEVLLKTFDKFKLNTHNKLNGDYAYIILDRLNKEIFISIDRFTSKPLFRYENNDFLVISSEINTIIKLQVENFQINQSFIQNYIDSNFWLFNESGSIDAYRNIKQLIGNTYYRVDLNNFKTTEHKQSYEINKYNSLKDIQEIVIDSVNLRKKSDRKLGVLISGGLDSSTIANLLKKEHDIDYFYTDTNDNDSYYAKYVIDELKLNAKKIDYSNDNLLENINELNRKYLLPTPIYGESIGMFSLYKNIRNEYGKYILLTGHGGDEIFGGNFLFINILEELLKKKGFFYLLNFLQKAQIPQNHIKEVILFFINKIYFIKGNYRFYKNKKIRDLKER